MESLANNGWYFGHNRDNQTGIDRYLLGLKSITERHSLVAAIRGFANGIKAEAHASGKTAAIWAPHLDSDLVRQAMPEPWVERRLNAPSMVV